MLVGERIRALEAERKQAETALATLDLERRDRTALDIEDACAVLDSLPDLAKTLAKAEPELRRRVYEAFYLAVDSTANTPQIRLKALVSSAFPTATDLDSIASTVTDKSIAGAGSVLISPTHRVGRMYHIVEVRELP